MEFLTAPDAWIARLLFERGLAVLHAIAFLSAFHQFPALLGGRGLLPAPDFLKGRTFRETPSLFHWRYSDRLFRLVAWGGMLLSLAIAAGAFARAPPGCSMAAWLVIWFLYLSIVNVGQTFYSFGWESMMLEAGFFAAFLGPEWMEPPLVPLLILRWMLFRTELGAGLIKLRHGGEWRDGTALLHHHETQPLPNPLSRAAHHLPRPVLRGGVWFSHFVQVALPFALFLPQPAAGTAALLMIIHQLLLIAAGNYAWLNWITIVLGFVAIPDAWFRAVLALEAPAVLAPRPLAWDIGLLFLAGWTVVMSIQPAKNLCSKRQLMNFCWNRWHLVNAYGAFGTVTKRRYEIVIEGTASAEPSDPRARWLEYEFKGKPGSLRRVPPLVAPYHLRLDWLMWFLPFEVAVAPGGIHVRRRPAWFRNLVRKLLEGDAGTLHLLAGDPFPDAPPRHIRARFYLYQFTTRAEKRRSGGIWKRTPLGEYLPPVGLEDFR